MGVKQVDYIINQYKFKLFFKNPNNNFYKTNDK